MPDYPMARDYRSKRMRSASTSRSPRGVPAVSFRSIGRLVQHLGQRGPGGRVHVLPLLLAEVGQLGPVALELGHAQRLEAGPQRGDDRGGATLAAGGAVALDLVGDDGPGRHRLLLAVAQGLGHRGAQRVHVEQRDAVEPATAGSTLRGHARGRSRAAGRRRRRSPPRSSTWDSAATAVSTTSASASSAATRSSGAARIVERAARGLAHEVLGPASTSG